ncbi:MAG: hypothetical protein ACTSRP_20515 [Candidatus Helarchaeota archaeon]
MPRRRRKRSKQHEFSSWVRVLSILGGVLAIIIGVVLVFQWISVPFTIIPSELGALLISIICAVVNIVLGVVLLIAYGVISSTKKFSVNWFILFVVGVTMLLFGGLAGILVLIAGILDLVGVIKD